jgi:hypothetical protein
MHGTQTSVPPPQLLEAIANLARFHHEHEKFYSQAPLVTAVELQASSRALKALAAHWQQAQPAEHRVAVPFAGADDLNAPGLAGESGILFMEGDDEPAELAGMRRELAAAADGSESAGAWLSSAMEQAWGVAAGLVRFPQLADLLGERHRIISADAQAASMSTLAGRSIHRALDLLGAVDFTPAAIRADLAGSRAYPAYLLSASELLDHAADLLAQSATLVHENERRWRVFAARVEQLRAAAPAEG